MANTNAGKPWSKNDEARLMQLVRNHTYEQIAIELNRSVRGVTTHIGHILTSHLTKERKMIYKYHNKNQVVFKRRAWSKSDEYLLKFMFSINEDIDVMSNLLQRSYRALYTHMDKLKLNELMTENNFQTLIQHFHINRDVIVDCIGDIYHCYI